MRRKRLHLSFWSRKHCLRGDALSQTRTFAVRVRGREVSSRPRAESKIESIVSLIFEIRFGSVHLLRTRSAACCTSGNWPCFPIPFPQIMVTSSDCTRRSRERRISRSCSLHMQIVRALSPFLEVWIFVSSTICVLQIPRFSS